MKTLQKVIVSVSTDLSSDQRVQKISESLSRKNYEVLLIGRKLPRSRTFEANEYQSRRFNLWFNKGFLFYANLNLRLLLKLLFSKVDVLYANDLDVLPANYIAARLKGVHLVYDSHEYFTEVPELISRPRIQSFWERLERWILPQLKTCITVTPKIAEVYKEKYGAEFSLVRNFPVLGSFIEVDKEEFIIYQGALNVGRGLEQLIEAMPIVQAKLLIAGGRDIEGILREKSVS